MNKPMAMVPELEEWFTGMTTIQPAIENRSKWPFSLVDKQKDDIKHIVYYRRFCSLD